MKAPLLVLTACLVVASPAVAQSPKTKPVHQRPSKHALHRMHRGHYEDTGVSVVAGSGIKRNSVGEVISPQVPSVTPSETSVINAPIQTPPAAAVKHP